MDEFHTANAIHRKDEAAYQNERGLPSLPLRRLTGYGGCRRVMPTVRWMDKFVPEQNPGGLIRLSGHTRGGRGAILHRSGGTIPRIESPIPVVTRVPKDDYLLAYAVVGEADYLITGDNDLLALQQVAGVTICRSRDFVDGWLEDEQ